MSDEAELAAVAVVTAGVVHHNQIPRRTRSPSSSSNKSRSLRAMRLSLRSWSPRSTTSQRPLRSLNVNLETRACVGARTRACAGRTRAWAHGPRPRCGAVDPAAGLDAPRAGVRRSGRGTRPRRRGRRRRGGDHQPPGHRVVARRGRHGLPGAGRAKSGRPRRPDHRGAPLATGRQHLAAGAPRHPPAEDAAVEATPEPPARCPARGPASSPDQRRTSRWTNQRPPTGRGVLLLVVLLAVLAALVWFFLLRDTDPASAVSTTRAGVGWVAAGAEPGDRPGRPHGLSCTAVPAAAAARHAAQRSGRSTGRPPASSG